MNHLGMFIINNIGWPGRVHDATVFANSNICDVAGENRPTGAYFIIEFDLTKVIGIFRRKISYDIIVI